MSMLLLGSCGCANFVDQITSRDFKVRKLWEKPPDPLKVLADPSHDGSERAKALARLKEPETHGGTKEQQELYIKILVQAATKNPVVGPDIRDRYKGETDRDCLEPLVRLGAIRALGEYKDPRAAEALVQVYTGTPKELKPGTKSAPLPFTDQINSNIKMQALQALEKTGSPQARELFLVVAKSPGPTNVTQENVNRVNDERLTALRGLARFHDREVLETLVGMMEKDDKNNFKEKNIAIRDRAYLSLKSITHKSLPQDAIAWRNLIQSTPPESFAQRPSKFSQYLPKFMGN